MTSDKNRDVAAAEAAERAATAEKVAAEAEQLRIKRERDEKAKENALKRGKSSKENAGGSGFGSMAGTPKPGMDDAEAKKLTERAERAETEAFRLRQEVKSTRAAGNRDRLLLRHMLVTLSDSAEEYANRAAEAEGQLVASRTQLERVTAERDKAMLLGAIQSMPTDDSAGSAGGAGSSSSSGSRLCRLGRTGRRPEAESAEADGDGRGGARWEDPGVSNCWRPSSVWRRCRWPSA